jgi:lysyl-tRNA synthetase class 2
VSSPARTDEGGSPAEAPQAPHPPSRRRERTVPRLRDDRWPDWLATVTLALAAFVLVIAAVPPWRGYFSADDDAVSLLFLPVLPNLTYAALLFVLGVGLRRRLRPAWWVFVVLLVVLPSLGRVASIVRGEAVALNALGLVVAAGILVVAIGSRRQFAARPARAAGLKALAFFLVGVVVAGLVGSWLLMTFGGVTDPADAGAVVGDTLAGDLGRVGDTVAVDAPFWVRSLVALLGAVVVLGSAAVLLRTPPSARRLGAVDEARVRTLLREHGDGDSLGYFATRRDKAVIWDDDAAPRAGVSYRVVRGVSLASGDPVGDPAHWPGAIEAWRRDARTHGWSLAVMAAGEAGARAYEEAGLVPFEIGDEAIVDVSTFSLNAPGLKPVRQAVHRLRRRGYTADVRRHGELGPADFERLATWMDANALFYGTFDKSDQARQRRGERIAGPAIE